MYIVILHWFVSFKTVEKTFKCPSTFIEEEMVKAKPENWDKNVDVHFNQNFFTQEAWLLVTDVVRQNQINGFFVCETCSHDADKFLSVICDYIVSPGSYHLKCAGLKRTPIYI